MGFLATLSFWDKIWMVLGLAGLLLLLIRFHFKFARKEKDALIRIDEFMDNRMAGQSDNHPCTMDHDSQRSKWKHPDIGMFYREYVEPYTQVLWRIDALDAVVDLLALLDDEGHCPSIAGRGHQPGPADKSTDLEASRWQSVHHNAYDILHENVSLREHTLNVASMIVEQRKKEGRDFLMELGRLLIVSLGHDIGKIPGRSKCHAGKDHPMASRDVLDEILPADYPSRDEILAAVRDHHFSSAAGSALLNHLKTADHKARQMELKKYGCEATIDPPSLKTAASHPTKPDLAFQKPRYASVDLSWLELSQLLQLVAGRVNVVENGKYEAFSHAGIVYVYPRLLAQCACHLAMQAGRMEVVAHMATDEKMEALTYAIRKALNEHVPDKLIGAGYIGRKFQIVAGNGDRMNPGFYLPLKISAFTQTSPSDIEKRKQGVAMLQSIRSVSVYYPDS
jgi:hypothetical protein